MAKATSRSSGRARAGSVILLAASVSGCVVGPDYEAPLLPLPTHWGSAKPVKAAKPAELSQWWRRLGDPMLGALIAEAVQSNLDVASAKAKIRAARATHRQAVGALFPSLEGTASVTRNKTAAGTTGSSTGTNASSIYTQYQAGLDASWEIDLFGANRRAVEAAAYGVDTAEEDLRSTLLTMVGDIAYNYANARGYQARTALARRTAASQRETAALTRTKFEVGSASAVDVAKAEAQASSTAANIPDYEAAYAQSVHRLAVLLGRPPATLMRGMNRIVPIPTPRSPMPTGIPADLLLSRPDVRSAERQLAQYTAKIGQAEAARYPSVTLTGNIATTANKFGELGKSSTISWSFGPSLTLPIFNGGQLRAAVDFAEAQRDQYFMGYHSAVLTALEDVENAIVALSQERIKIQRLTQAVDNYRQAARLSRTLFQAGSAGFFDVLDAERSLYSAEDSLLQSRVAIAVDYIALCKALGGGWDGAIDSSQPAVVDLNTRPHLPPRH
jgi:outer membrane protein, multidrug efflux system